MKTSRQLIFFSVGVRLAGLALFGGCTDNKATEQGYAALVSMPAPTKWSFVHLADAHFDPFYDAAEVISGGLQRQARYSDGTTCIQLSNGPDFTRSADFPLDKDSGGTPFGEYGANEPLATLTAVIAQAKTKNPAFAVVAGDLLTHSLWGQSKSASPPACGTVADSEPCCNDAIASLQITVDKLAESFGDQVIIAFGNNDGLPKNQFPALWGETLAKIYKDKKWLDDAPIAAAPQTWKTIDSSICGTPPSDPPPQTSFESFKLFGGYYRHLTTPADIHFIVLNTVIELYDKKAATGLIQPCLAAQQWQWVNELTGNIVSQDATAQIYIVGHVPPTHLKGADLLNQKYIYDYQVYLDKYKDNIKGQFFGDQNVDITRVYLAGIEQRLTADGSCKPYKVTDYIFGRRSSLSWITMASGVSPRMMNNPSFNWYGLADEKNATITSYVQNYLDLVPSNKARRAVFSEINFGLPTTPVMTGDNILKMLNGMTDTATESPKNTMYNLDQILLAGSPNSTAKASSLDPVVRRCSAMYHSECEIKNCCTANDCCGSIKKLEKANGYKQRKLDKMLCPKGTSPNDKISM